MPDESAPPPSRTAIAAAAGGFGGAVLGVIAATALMGDGDGGNGQAAVDPIDQQGEVVVAER